MARLMDGYERSRRFSDALGSDLFSLGIITALFHDIGYLRHRKDTRHRNGAEYTLHHVSRGAYFLDEYMQEIGMPEWARVAGRIIHFTGYEIPVQRIDVPSPAHRLLGNMLGSADIMHRNLDRRGESLVKVTDPAHCGRLREVIARGMDDSTSSWWLDREGNWTRHARDAAGAPLRDVQEGLIIDKSRGRLPDA